MYVHYPFQGFTWTFWLKLQKVGTKDLQILTADRPGIDVYYRHDGKVSGLQYFKLLVNFDELIYST